MYNIDVFTATRQFYFYNFFFFFFFLFFFFFFFFFCHLKHPHPAEVLLCTMAYPCGHFDDDCAKLQVIKSVHTENLAAVYLPWWRCYTNVWFRIRFRICTGDTSGDTSNDIHSPGTVIWEISPQFSPKR